jgi:hypothetical protein
MALTSFTFGCTLSGTAPTDNLQAGDGESGNLSGIAHGGRQPIAGAQVYAFAAGKTGYGSPAKLLASTMTSTDGTGRFNFTGTNTITCPGTSDATYSNTLYIVIAGGQPTPGVTNTDAVLLAVLGDCGTAVTNKPFTVVNEVTTFASMTAMQQFFNPYTVNGALATGLGENFGAPSTNLTGLINAANAVPNLVTLSLGTAGATSPVLTANSTSGTSAANQTVTVTTESSKINLAANVLATCVNSSPGAICNTLFSNVTSASIVDTLQAAYYMAANPTDLVNGTSNIATVATSAVATLPFSPSLAVSSSSYPNDWSIGVQYGSSTYTTVGASNRAYFVVNPQSLAVDRLGDIWILNAFTNSSSTVGNSVSEIDPTGVPLQTAFIGSNGLALTGPNSIVIDPFNNVFVSNYGNSASGKSVVEYPNCASPCTAPSSLMTFNTGTGPGPMASDGAGNIFISTATAGAGDLEEVPAGSASEINATHYAGSLTATNYSGMAIDPNFNIYLASGSNASPAIYMFPAGSYSTANAYTGSVIGYPIALGLDAASNIFFSNYAAGNLGEIGVGTPAGANAKGSLFGGGSLVKTEKLVLDGSANIWATNTVTSGSGAVSEIATSNSIFSNGGATLSPAGGYGSVTGTLLTARNYNQTSGLALDASGNVWVGAGSGSAITEIVGLATPVITPIAANLPATGAAALSNVPVPTSGAYFGGWANPTGGASDPVSVNGYTTTLESQIGRKLRIHMHYYGWGTDGSTVATSIPAFPDQAETDDVNAGRIPLITWTCGDNNSVVAVASSTVNTPTYNLIVATAQAVKTFSKPMFIRWNWEMNDSGGGSGKCMGGTSVPLPTQYANFIGAWQNIYNIFKAQGVTNVSWLWNPGMPGGLYNAPDPAPYYPGNAYVDWIGFDGYDKVSADHFGPVFNPFYQEFGNATYGNKPIMIGETGECPSYQSVYLADATAEIAGRANSGNYNFSPLVRAFLYFDSPGQYVGCTWTFQSTLPFATMGSDPYFTQ